MSIIRMFQPEVRDFFRSPGASGERGIHQGTQQWLESDDCGSFGVKKIIESCFSQQVA